MALSCCTALLSFPPVQADCARVCIYTPSAPCGPGRFLTPASLTATPGLRSGGQLLSLGLPFRRLPLLLASNTSTERLSRACGVASSLHRSGCGNECAFIAVSRIRIQGMERRRVDRLPRPCIRAESTALVTRTGHICGRPASKHVQALSNTSTSEPGLFYSLGSYTYNE